MTASSVLDNVLSAVGTSFCIGLNQETDARADRWDKAFDSNADILSALFGYLVFGRCLAFRLAIDRNGLSAVNVWVELEAAHRTAIDGAYSASHRRIGGIDVVWKQQSFWALGARFDGA